MPTSVSIERRKLMRFLGARVVLTPKEDKAMGCYLKAVELAEANQWFLARQFEQMPMPRFMKIPPPKRYSQTLLVTVLTTG